MVEKTFTVIDPLGIHARPATTLIQYANRFVSDIKLEYENKLVNVKSIMGVMSLGLERGAAFKLTINGRDEENAFEQISAFLKDEGLAEQG
ncbi:phosphocarrier protein HPr [Sediminibacillus massiliensis]|uniref:phosphocarrier protein HPr n=1 Tax=Sediminibacillus massiliensis TaxID=1926277 RepID=UPI0009886BB6|nr:phosphocarrier protein HPr [Sediminibacillus massiliensis]